MIRRRPLLGRAGGPPPGRRRATPMLGLLTGVSVCALAASALFVPGFVLGAEAPSTGAESSSTAAEPVGADPATPETLATPATAEITTIDEYASPSPSRGTVLVTLRWGDGEDEVGLQKPAEGLVRGPEALAIAPDGRIAVLDSVNRRIVLLDSSGSAQGAVPVPVAEPRFLAVDNERLYVLDCDADRSLVMLTWEGVTLDAVTLPELDDVVTGLFATSRGPCLEIAHDRVFLVRTAGSDSFRAAAADGASAGAGGNRATGRAMLRPVAGRPFTSDLGRLAKVSFRPGRGVEIRSYRAGQNDQAVETAQANPVLAAGRTLEHLLSVDGDGRGGLIVGARLLGSESDPAGRASLVLTRLASRGGSPWDEAISDTADLAIDTIFLDDPSLAYVGQPYVVAPDGRVFQPVAGSDGYSLLVHEFPAVSEVQP